MRTTFHILIAFLCLFCQKSLGKNERTTDVERLGLYGKVKTYTIYNAKIENNIIVRGTKHSETEFDSLGNLKEKRHYDEDGSVFLRTKSTIRKDGKVMSEKTYDKDGREFKSCENIYDKKKRLIRTIYFSEKGEINRKDTIIYHKQGRTEIQHDHSRNHILRKEYDKKGNLLGSHMKSGAHNATNSYSYNERGDIIKKTCILERFNSTTADTTTTSMKYNAFGFLYEKNIEKGNELQEQYTYHCDSKGLKTDEFLYDGAQLLKANKESVNENIAEEAEDIALKHHITYKHDEKGNLTEQVHYNGPKSIFTYGKIYEITYY